MTIKTNVKAGGISVQHNETLTVRTNVKAGLGPWVSGNHNETLAVRSNVKAGLGCKYCMGNHNESFCR
jgi:hypothetical protein